MPIKNPIDYTVSELKELLRIRNLDTTGLKAELIQRLTEAEPNIWDRPQEEQRIQNNHHHETENDNVGASSSGTIYNIYSYFIFKDCSYL